MKHSQVLDVCGSSESFSWDGLDEVLAQISVGTEKKRILVSYASSKYHGRRLRLEQGVFLPLKPNTSFETIELTVCWTDSLAKPSHKEHQRLVFGRVCVCPGLNVGYKLGI